MTPFRTLISVEDLRSLMESGRAPLLLDARFDLADTSAGEKAHAQGHLPGALYVHLDKDLSSDKVDANGRFRGRHPLPTREAFARTAASLGVEPGRQVVVYDSTGGMYASRAWWMLRWIGHGEAAVLDGGFPAWVAAGAPVETRIEARREPVDRDPGASAVASIEADELLRSLGSVTLVDARAPERYHGEVEPLDPVAGHIPGAVNRFYQLNLRADGRFKTTQELREAFQPLASPGRPVVHQCGSGVTACHNVLAMEHAGLAGSVLYPGSWSEWCSDPTRPVERS